MGGDPELDTQTGTEHETVNVAGPLVDIHTHVLPGVDDGPRTMENALQMLRLAEADGIDLVIATPHAHHCNPVEIPERVNRLNAAASQAAISVTVLPGSEVRIAPDLADRYLTGELVMLNNTSYLLLELYLDHQWQHTTVCRVIDRLLSIGIKPILAHPERYPYLHNDLDVIQQLVNSGVLMQINAPSLTGYYGSEARQFAWQLIDLGIAHLIASDAHNPEWRPPLLTSSYQRVARQTGRNRAQSMAELAASIGTPTRAV